MTSVMRVQGARRKTADLSTAVGAKNDALIPGRVPHVRLSVHGPKTDSSNAFAPCETILALGRNSFASVAERWKGLRPVFFGPRTLVRTLIE